MMWLTSKIGVALLAGLLVVVAGAALIDGIRNRAAIAELNRGNDKLSGWLAEAQRNLGTCHANVGTVSAALDRQGADIRGLADASKAVGDRAAAAAAVAAKDSKAAREASQSVLALPRPAPEVACIEAGRLLRGPM